MRTFLPYPDLRASCVVLDDKRLGKQRVETSQILRALTWPRFAWKNHPAVRMWRGFVPGLALNGLATPRRRCDCQHPVAPSPRRLRLDGARRLGPGAGRAPLPAAR